MTIFHEYEGHPSKLFRVRYGPIWVGGRRILIDSNTLLSIYDLLRQDRIWCDSESRLLHLEEMHPEHVENLIHYLKLKARGLKPWWMFWRSPEDWMKRQPLMRRLREMNHESN